MLPQFFPSSVQIIQSAVKTFYARLFYKNTGEPFDLTGVTEIVASFPGAGGAPLKKTFSNSGGVTIIGANGAGKIQIALSSTDTAQLNPNPNAAQDLQITATINGFAQVDTYSFGSPPVATTVYTATVNGNAISYTAQSGDTAQTVFNSLKASIDALAMPISTVVGGTGNSATLQLTSTIAGLGFTDAVSNGFTLTPTTPNGGSRTVFILSGTLNILPQDYLGA